VHAGFGGDERRGSGVDAGLPACCPGQQPRSAARLGGGGFASYIRDVVGTGFGGLGRQAGRLGPQEHATREKAMTEKNQNVQDVFLNNIRKNKAPVTIFLINGVKLQGIVTWFDNFSVLLRRDAHSQLVYKHAISTIMPTQPIQLFEKEKDEDAG
jgi:host factor-I protein